MRADTAANAQEWVTGLNKVRAVELEKSPVEAEGKLDDEASYAFGVTAWIQERLDAHIEALLAAAAPGSGEEEV